MVSLKYLPTKSWLFIQKSKMENFSLFLHLDLQDVIPLHTKCPATITKQGRTYQVTINIGEPISLQDENSDVELLIQDGCPKGAYLMEVRTDLQDFIFGINLENIGTVQL